VRLFLEGLFGSELSVCGFRLTFEEREQVALMMSACVVIMPCGRSLSKPFRAGLQTGNRPYAERLPAAPPEKGI